MQVEMTIEGAVEFLEQHVDALECSLDDCFFVEAYDLKQICAIKTLIAGIGHLERINPKLLARSVKYDYELRFNKRGSEYE